MSYYDNEPTKGLTWEQAINEVKARSEQWTYPDGMVPDHIEQYKGYQVQILFATSNGLSCEGYKNCAFNLINFYLQLNQTNN